MQLEDFAKRLHVDWRAELRDGARYIRQEITVRSSKDIRVREIVLVDLPAAGGDDQRDGEGKSDHHRPMVRVDRASARA